MDETTLKIIILVLVILFFIGLIIAFYWMWHKSLILKSRRTSHKHPDLVRYIHRATKHGLTKRQIKYELKRQGWPDDVVDQYL